MMTVLYPILAQPWGLAACGASLVLLGALLLLAARLRSWMARAGGGGAGGGGGKRKKSAARGRRKGGRSSGGAKGRKGGAALGRASARAPLVALPALVLAAAGLYLGVTGARSWLDVRSLRGQHPAPGELVEVGGHDMHILAEGDSPDGGPVVVWIPGGHAQGLALHHLHAAVRDEVRSILFDRFGTGWSDPGPFPRRTAREADELAELLESAGEEGPFVLVGHSYGGFLAANFARRNLARTAALVLLDASPPDAFIYAPAYGASALEDLVRDAERQGLAKAMGRWTNPETAMAQGEGEIAEIIRGQRNLLADVLPAMEANQRRPASSFATASVFREFGSWSVLGAAPDFVVYDGELGDLPVLVVIPDEDMDGIIQPLRLDVVAARRARNFFERSRTGTSKCPPTRGWCTRRRAPDTTIRTRRPISWSSWCASCWQS